MSQKWQSYDVQFQRYGVRLTECFVILGHFLTFHPPSDPENQNFEKMKKMYGDIILLQMCTINEDHMTYGPEIYDVRHIFLSFWVIFCPFTPSQPGKSRFWNYEKKYLEILPFNTCTPYMTIIWCKVPEIWIIFCPFTPLTIQKIKISKQWKKQLELS